MAHYIYIYTDNNRTTLTVETEENQVHTPSSGRLVYREIHETAKTASFRMNELKTYTRMQLERIVRRANPNWLNLAVMDRARVYQPGAKFNPNVPKRTSLR